MFKRIFIISIFIVGLSTAFLFCGNVSVYFYSTAVTTHTPVLILGDSPSRKMASCYNDDSTYAIYLSTWLPADLDALVAAGTYNPLNAESSTRDDFFVYKSSWYATASTSAVTGKLFYMEKQ